MFAFAFLLAAGPPVPGPCAGDPAAAAPAMSWSTATAPGSAAGSFAFVGTTGQASTAPASATGDVALTLTGGRLLLDGTAQLEGIGVLQRPFTHLVLYLPGRGLVVVGAAPFEGARPAGEFEGCALTATVDGGTLRLESATPILDGATRPAWVRVDPAFTLDTRTALHGYGDPHDLSRRWRAQFPPAGRRPRR